MYGTRVLADNVIRLRHAIVLCQLRSRRILGNLAGLQQLQSCAFRCRREFYRSGERPEASWQVG
jgi:hypothetical protein